MAEIFRVRTILGIGTADRHRGAGAPTLPPPTEAPPLTPKIDEQARKALIDAVTIQQLALVDESRPPSNTLD